MKVGDAVLLSRAYDEILRNPLKARVAFRLMRSTKPLRDAAAEFEKARIETVMRLGKQNEDGGYDVRPENAAAFSSEMTELLEEEIAAEPPRLSMADIGEFYTSIETMTILLPYIDDYPPDASAVPVAASAPAAEDPNLGSVAPEAVP